MRAFLSKIRSAATNLSARAVFVRITLGVSLCILGLRHIGAFQSIEFQAYDFLIRRQPKAPSSEPLVLIEMTEADIQRPDLDYPLPDDKLADLLLKLEADQPAVIGLDIWRDIPVPKRAPAAHAALNGVLTNYQNIVAIFTLGGIKPPPALGTDPTRVAFNDCFVPDLDVDSTVPKVRRCLLMAAIGPRNFDSIPYRLALQYLEQRRIRPLPDPLDPNAFRLGKARLLPFAPNDGAYVRADAVGWQMLLDFKCPDRFTRYTVGQALDARIPPGTLRDKIVLVGVNTPSVADDRVTPVLRQHPGIQLVAGTVNQLLRHALNGEKPLQFWTPFCNALWILLWATAGTLVVSVVRSPWKSVLASLVALSSLAGLGAKAFAMNWWIPMATPAAAFLTAAATMILYLSSQERLMRSVLMRLYSRHVSKEIAESIWANRDRFLSGSRPIAQKLVVTVLFSDIKGFSGIAERMEPAELYKWVNAYLSAMAPIIAECGGVIKQFTGDGIMVLFGVPVPRTTPLQQAEDARSAVRCASAMGHRLEAFNRELRQMNLPTVSMRVGIYTGEVAAGNIGSDDRFEYGVIGDVVNTAARLESYDKSLADPDLLPNRCRILIGAPTRDLLNGEFTTTEIGSLEVYGKKNKVPISQVLAPARQP